MGLSQFAQDLLAQVPEDKRKAVEEALTADVDKFLSDGASRQSDYSRKMDQLRNQQKELEASQAQLAQKRQETETWHQNLTTWYEQQQAALAAGGAGGNGDGEPQRGADGKFVKPAAPELPADILRKGDFEKALNEREAGAAAFFATLQQLSFTHYRQFGDVLDTAALLARPEIREHGLVKGYERVYADQIKAKADEAYKTKVEQDVQTRLAEERKKSLNPAYPSGAPPMGSPLDALTGEGKPPALDQQAADAYLDLVAKHAAAGG